jgi:hypothetical protein
MIPETKWQRPPCQERDRLTNAYLAAVVEHGKIGARYANHKSEVWREATKETSAACEAAIADLNAHRKEHGC